MEDVLDGLLGAAEPRPVTIGIPKEDPSELPATHALLLYSGGSGSSRAIVTTHTIARASGRYVLLPGKPASAAALFQLLARCNPSIAHQGILPWNLLRHTPAELLWHCRAGSIRSSSKRTRRNSIPSAAPVYCIRISCLRTSGESVYCRPAGRPAPDPANEALSGALLQRQPGGEGLPGNHEGPASKPAQSLSQWERAFFHSAFTHPHGGAFAIHRIQTVMRGFGWRRRRGPIRASRLSIWCP